ncbi:MAG: hypothetical protein EBV32_03950 [Proteobacteria bacterium]|uniref:Uncharacterized protein n=1 Tax=Candidatus Fonsibacter lacus TaxID=2576439 RepID=A0A964V097_9PROT|nr:hypothetical protein [Candidatus Fonsibacter lacus]
MKKAIVTDRLLGAAPTDMDLRDYFAGQALTGLLANPKLEKAILEKQEWVEKTTWLFADAVMERRLKDNR